MNFADVLLLVHAAATWLMFGVIWFVQRVNYPMFSRYGRDDFSAVMHEHQRRTTSVVAPAMLVECVTAVALLAYPPAGVPIGGIWAGVVLVALVWASTAWLQIPIHRRLTAGYDAATDRRLVATNRLRVLLWGGRGVLVAWMVGVRLKSSSL